MKEASRSPLIAPFPVRMRICFAFTLIKKERERGKGERGKTLKR